MHPLAVGPAPDILAGRDDRTAPRADLAHSVRLVVAPQGAVLVLVTDRPVVWPRGAQIFLHSLFNLAAAEIWWGSHVCLPRVRWRVLPADSQSGPQRLPGPRSQRRRQAADAPDAGIIRWAAPHMLTGKAQRARSYQLPSRPPVRGTRSRLQDHHVIGNTATCGAESALSVSNLANSG